LLNNKEQEIFRRLKEAKSGSRVSTRFFQVVDSERLRMFEQPVSPWLSDALDLAQARTKRLTKCCGGDHIL
jgi:hypothetical protein